MLRFLTALLLTLTWTGPAQAAPENGFYGFAEKLVFTSATTFDADDGTRALCTHVKDWAIFSIPVHREVIGYVLADKDCTGAQFSNVSADAVGLLVSSGIIVENVPVTPDLSEGWTVWSLLGLVFSVLGFLFFVLSKTRRKPLADFDAPPVTKQTPMFDETLLTTMFHTARLDGDINQMTLQTLIKSYKTLTGTTVTPAMINAKYALQTDTVDLLSIMPQFVGLERDTMMKACLDVAAADGAIQKPEHDFLMALGSALGLDGDMFRNQVRAAMQPARRTSTLVSPALA